MPGKELLQLNVNGDAVAVAVRPSDTLLDALRDTIGLTGTKRGCDDGSCGACTVLIAGRPALACLVLALTVDGDDVTTIEAASAHPASAAVQQALVEEGGVQCGYCTPGIVLAAHALFAEYPAPDDAQIVAGLANNLCRCTGYARIVEAVRRVARATAAS